MDNCEIYYDVAKSQTAAQEARKRQLEFRASGAVALAAALLGIAGISAANWHLLLFIPAAVMVGAFAGWRHTG